MSTQAGSAAGRGSEAPAAPPGPTREYRGTVTFTLIALLSPVVLLLSVIADYTAPPIVRLAATIGSGATTAVLFGVGLGLSAGRPWARVAMTPLLLVLLIAGVITFVAALLRSAIEVPFGALFAIWALRAPVAFPVAAAARHRAAGLAAVGVLVAATFWPAAASLVLQPGGPLVAARSDFEIATSLSGCIGEGGELPTAAPEAIDVTVTWQWLRGDAWPSGSDRLTVTWISMLGQGGGWYYYEGWPEFDSGITLEDLLAGRPRYGAVFRIDLEKRRAEPGQVTFRIHRPEPRPTGLGEILVQVEYEHNPDAAGERYPQRTWMTHDQQRCEWLPPVPG